MGVASGNAPLFRNSNLINDTRGSLPTSAIPKLQICQNCFYLRPLSGLTGSLRGHGSLAEKKGRKGMGGDETGWKERKDRKGGEGQWRKRCEGHERGVLGGICPPPYWIGVWGGVLSLPQIKFDVFLCENDAI